MELATAVIWTLRIVLPIILFCIYFKVLAPKDEQHVGPAGRSYSRGQILAYRKVALAECPVPQELADIALKDQAQAPALFVPSGRGARAPAARREPERGGPPRERRDKRGDGRKSEKQRDSGDEPEQGLGAEEPFASEDKMHLESLLNYVAFNRKEQQRTFLPDEAGAPPPPPKARAPRAAAGQGPEGHLGGPAAAAAAISGPTAEKANAEAQMVLRGAISFKRSDVARDIYGQLADSQVEIAERTFSLMIEACILARDLKSASDFLMKMETSGYCPDSELLDKVMDLYAQQKSTKERQREVQQPSEPVGTANLGTVPVPFAQMPGFAAGPTMAAEEAGHDGPRAKLSSSAPVFVPSFGIPPAPPRPGLAEISSGGAVGLGVVPVPLAQLPGFLPGPAMAVAEATLEGPRAKLSSSAPVFVPSFGIPPPPPKPRLAESALAGQHSSIAARGTAWRPAARSGMVR